MATHYGGQALIEGVLIRGRAGVFAAVRAPGGHLVTRELRLDADQRGPLRRIPILRGLLALGDTLSFGSQMLLFSADVAAGGSGEQLTPGGKRAAVGAASAAAVLFAIAPAVVSVRLKTPGLRHKKSGSSISDHLVESAARAGIFLIYLAAVGRLKEVQRIFAYHGAEHKSISALEAGVELVPEAVQKFDTAHPRCGTAFLFQSILTSSLIYGAVGDRTPLGRIGTRVALVPVVAGVSFEVLQFNARHLDSAFIKLLNVPGMLLQRLTTRQPTDEQVLVALEALRGAMAMDEQSGQD